MAEPVDSGGKLSVFMNFGNHIILSGILWLTIAAGAVSCTKKDVEIEETFNITRAEIQEIVETGLQRSHSQAMLLAKSLE